VYTWIVALFPDTIVLKDPIVPDQRVETRVVTVEVIDEIILILFSVTQLHEKLKNALQLEGLKALQITGLALEQFPGVFP
jgi:hypothetical protein